MGKERSFIDNFFLFVKGVSMGAANKVPGVSGGTVAFVLEFYEELIYSFQKINIKAVKLLISGKFKLFFEYTNAKFLLLVMGGSMFSYFSISLVLDYFIRYYELYVWSTFFGMILGSVYYIAKDFENWSKKNIAFTIVGASIGIAISLISPAKENTNLWFVFFCGIIGVSGMTLPGLSGSFILMLLGNYVLLLVDSVNMLLRTITDILSGNWAFLHDTIRIKYLKIVSVFTAGSAFGLVSISHVLGYVLKRWHQVVNAVIIGFIAGSLGVVWPWKREVFQVVNNQYSIDFNGNKVIENYERYIPNMSDVETYIAILFIIFGVSILLVVDYYTNRKNKIKNI